MVFHLFFRKMSARRYTFKELQANPSLLKGGAYTQYGDVNFLPLLSQMIMPLISEENLLGSLERGLWGDEGGPMYKKLALMVLWTPGSKFTTKVYNLAVVWIRPEQRRMTMTDALAAFRTRPEEELVPIMALVGLCRDTQLHPLPEPNGVLVEGCEDVLRAISVDWLENFRMRRMLTTERGSLVLPEGFSGQPMAKTITPLKNKLWSTGEVPTIIVPLCTTIPVHPTLHAFGDGRPDAPISILDDEDEAAITLGSGETGDSGAAELITLDVKKEDTSDVDTDQPQVGTEEEPPLDAPSPNKSLDARTLFAALSAVENSPLIANTKKFVQTSIPKGDVPLGKTVPTPTKPRVPEVQTKVSVPHTPSVTHEVYRGRNPVAEVAGLGEPDVSRFEAGVAIARKLRDKEEVLCHSEWAGLLVKQEEQWAQFRIKYSVANRKKQGDHQTRTRESLNKMQGELANLEQSRLEEENELFAGQLTVREASLTGLVSRMNMASTAFSAVVDMAASEMPVDVVMSYFLRRAADPSGGPLFRSCLGNAAAVRRHTLSKTDETVADAKDDDVGKTAATSSDDKPSTVHEKRKHISSDVGRRSEPRLDRPDEPDLKRRHRDEVEHKRSQEGSSRERSSTGRSRKVQKRTDDDDEECDYSDEVEDTASDKASRAKIFKTKNAARSAAHEVDHPWVQAQRQKLVSELDGVLFVPNTNDLVLILQAMVLAGGITDVYWVGDESQGSRISGMLRDAKTAGMKCIRVVKKFTSERIIGLEKIHTDESTGRKNVEGQNSGHAYCPWCGYSCTNLGTMNSHIRFHYRMGLGCGICLDMHMIKAEPMSKHMKEEHDQQ